MIIKEHPCETCGDMVRVDLSRCSMCYYVEEYLVEYLESRKGQDFVRQRLPELPPPSKLQEEIQQLREENAQLQIASDILAALEAGGVDNWEGYEIAMENIE